MKRARPLLTALVLAIAGCTPPAAPAGARFALPLAPVPPRLAGLGARDWSFGRYGGPDVAAARAAAPAQAAATRRLLAFGDAGAWTSGGLPGLPLTTFGVDGEAVAAPAWAYRSTVPRLRGRVWFVTTTGWLVGLDRDDPTNTTNPDVSAITINLERAVSRGAVALSDDGRRAYVVTDDGTLCACDLAARSFTTFDLGGPARGIGVCVDPLLSDGSSATGPDVLFTARNDGQVFKLTWLAGGLSPAGPSVRGALSDLPLDGSNSLVTATPVAAGGVAWVGDRGGRLNRIDWRGAMPVVTAIYLPGAGAIETPVAVSLQNGEAHDVFASAGARVAWHKPTSVGEPGFTVVSRALVVDGAPGAAPEGRLADYPLRGTRLIGRPADEALTAVETFSGNDAALPGAGGRGGVRTDLVAAADYVDDVPALATPVYGRPGQPSAPTAGADVRSGSGVGGFAAPLGLAIGPDGEVYLGGKFSDAGLSDDGQHAAEQAWVIPAKPMADRWGWATLEAGRAYPIAGPGSRNGAETAPVPGLREPHGIWHDDQGTPSRADDALWIAAWRGNAVYRVGPDGQAVKVAGAGAGAAAGHPPGASWPAEAGLGRPHSLCVTRGGADPGAVYVAEADHAHLLRLDPSTGQASAAVALPAPATGLWHDRRTDAVYIASRTGDRVWRYDLATRTLMAIAGTGQPGHDPDGTLATQARLEGPEAITVDATTGDVYIGEAAGTGATGQAGFRVKHLRVADDRLTTLAGDGRGAWSGGATAPATGLGRIAGLALGPRDLAAEGAARDTLYLTGRDAHVVARLVPPEATANAALGFLQWRLGAAFAGRALLEATVKLVARTAPAGDPPRPDLVLASATAGGGATPWTATGLRPDALPAVDGSIAGVFDAGPGPEAAIAWEIGQRYAWTLPSERLPTGGTLALALQPGGSVDQHLGAGFTPVPSGAAEAPTFHGTADPERAPTLDAFVSDFALAGGLASPPAIGASGTKLYVANANAIFSLDWSDPQAFVAGTAYAATRLGRLANGSIDPGTTPATFVRNPTAPLVTFTNQVFALELKQAGAAWNFGLARFDGGATPGAMLTGSLAYDSKTAPAQTYQAGTFAAWDGFGNDFGALYFGLGDGRVYRAAQ